MPNDLSPLDEITGWIGDDPDGALIAIDRELVARGGLRAFAQLAWPVIEGVDATFRGGWHIDAVCEHLEAVSRGEIRRLMISMPPRHMKSLCAAVMWPVYDWITHPERRFVYSSYAFSLSVRDATKSRRIISSPWFQARWGKSFRLTSDQNMKSRYENNRTGHRISTSVRSMATGEGGDVVCFPYDEKVWTEFGPRPIGEIVDAREPVLVWGFDVWERKLVLRPVTGWHRNRGRPIFRVGLSDGSSYRSTADHRMWTHRGWIETGKLDESYRLPRAFPSRTHQGRTATSYEVVDNPEHTYCLTVADCHTMVVSETASVIASNCVDDPHLVKEAESEKRRENVLSWWDEQMSSRLNNPRTGAFVVVHQRVNARDLIGHLRTKASPIPWTDLCLPAEFEPDHPQRWFRDPRAEVGELLWPEHQDRAAIDALKQALGPYAAAGQLQQRPAPREGGVFKRDWFPLIRYLPPDLMCVRGWDLAATEKQTVKSDPDWTTGVKVGWSGSLAKWIIVDVVRFREEWHNVQANMLAVAMADGVETLIQLPRDPAQAGKGQAQDLQRLLSRFTAYADPVTGDKMSRALKWAAKAGTGLVLVFEAAWNDDFFAEITSFPTGAHDDQVDGLSSAFDRLLSGGQGLAEWMRGKLRASGQDPATLKTSRERVAEEAAREKARAEARAQGKPDPFATWGRAMRPPGDTSEFS